MDEMSKIISENIKAIRKKRQESLDKFAELTGVSKSMLGQIERGESSPTISTLWKIATGLKISFTELTEKKIRISKIINNADIEPIINENGLMRIYPVFPYRKGKKFEVLFIEMEKTAFSLSLPHAPETEEYVIVYEGAIKITVGEESFVVNADSSIRYFADRPHSYENAFDGRTRLCMLIYYQ